MSIVFTYSAILARSLFMWFFSQSPKYDWLLLCISRLDLSSEILSHLSRCQLTSLIMWILHRLSSQLSKRELFFSCYIFLLFSLSWLLTSSSHKSGKLSLFYPSPVGRPKTLGPGHLWDIICSILTATAIIQALTMTSY